MSDQTELLANMIFEELNYTQSEIDKVNNSVIEILNKYIDEGAYLNMVVMDLCAYLDSQFEKNVETDSILNITNILINK